MTPPAIASTLLDEEWLDKNRAALRLALPETWTHPYNINFLALGFKLKLLGVDWRSQEELALCFAIMEKKRLLLRDGLLIRRSN